MGTASSLSEESLAFSTLHEPLLGTRYECFRRMLEIFPNLSITHFHEGYGRHLPLSLTKGALYNAVAEDMMTRLERLDLKECSIPYDTGSSSREARIFRHHDRSHGFKTTPDDREWSHNEQSS